MKIDDFGLKHMILGWKNDFRGQKHVFMMILGTKIEIWKNVENFWKFYFFQNFIFDQEFDSNGPGA